MLTTNELTNNGVQRIVKHQRKRIYMKTYNVKLKTEKSGIIQFNTTKAHALKIFDVYWNDGGVSHIKVNNTPFINLYASSRLMPSPKNANWGIEDMFENPPKY